MPHSLSARTSRKAVFARLCALLLVLAASVLISACGNRGPLYLPDQDPADVTSDDALQATDDDDETDEDPRRRTADDIESDWP